MALNKINTIKIFTAEEIAASGVAFSSDINLDGYLPEGFIRLYLALTGDGTCKLEWKVSVDNKKNYIIPTSYNNVICSGFTKSSGVHSIEVGDTVLIFGASGMTEINGQTATVADVAAGTFTTDIDASGYTTYTSGGTARPVGKAADADHVITGISKANPAVVTVNKGKDLFPMTIPSAPYLKIKATETGGADSITISAWLVIV